MSKGSPISPSLMATKSAGAPKAPERVERPADAGVDTAAVSPVLGPNNVVPPTVMTGSQAIVRSLEELGVDDIFGLPGGAILPTYDPLMASRMNHVLVRHEQGAGHAAQGYAMVTGRVGVCIATSGPGATNLVTAIMDAHMDSVPMVAITGQVSSGVIGTDAFQEADIVGITMPITKHSFLVTDPNDIPHVMAEAFHLASTGRPGPGPGGRRQGRPAGPDDLLLAAEDRPARLPPGAPRPQQAGPRGRPAHRGGQQARALRGRRRRQGARLGGTAASSPNSPAPPWSPP